MNWLSQLVQQALAMLSMLFTTPLLDLGDKRLSVGTILLLLLLILGLLKMTRVLSQWLQRGVLVPLGMDRGTQEVISVFTRYLLTILGSIVILQTAGLNLSSLTVLAGAVGIGLGFGLQNLASNFVSGLTLLLERQIKVGDFIEIDHLSGTIEKISIRSTVIRTTDDVFIVIPNGRFVDNNIINWNYNNPRTRIRIPVSVAYGTDPISVTEVLLKIARLEPKVLTSPSPKVWLKEFGSSSLNFLLLVWIDEPESAEPIKSSINFLIEQEFRYRGITIPYPQQEIRILNTHELNPSLIRKKSDSQEVLEPSRAPLESLPNPQAFPETTSSYDLRRLLRRITYFEQCRDSDLRSLIEHGYRQIFSAEQVICQENSPGDCFYIILSGSVEVSSERARHYIATLHQGEFFGEISLLTGTPRSATVRALEETTLFVVDRADLQQLLNQHQELAEQIAQKLSERQQVLYDLGLMDEKVLRQMGETPFSWVRKRLHLLFGI